MGLGTDSAAAMVGHDKGLAGRMKRINPMLMNVGCIAHRLALCSSQAADKVAFLKDYQTTLTSLYTYFKHSSVRCEKLRAMQQVLQEDQIKVKEVYEVRWLAFYSALDAVFRCLDSLVSYFAQSGDAKDTGLGKKLSDENFVRATYSLMDIIPIINRLSEYFQKREIDIAYVPVAVRQCLDDLGKVRNEEETHERLLHDVLAEKKGRLTFKGHVLVKSRRAVSIKEEFIDHIVQNIKKRYFNYLACGIIPKMVHLQVRYIV